MKNNKKVDLNDYYLGVITASDKFLDNYTSNDKYYSPFKCLHNDKWAKEVGCVALLKKRSLSYSDMQNSLEDNGLKYNLGSYNKEGIALRYVVPFTDIYREEPKVYKSRDINCDVSVFKEIIDKSYFIEMDSDTLNEKLIIQDFFLENEVMNRYRKDIATGKIEVSEPLPYQESNHNGNVIQFRRK